MAAAAGSVATPSSARSPWRMTATSPGACCARSEPGLAITSKEAAEAVASAQSSKAGAAPSSRRASASSCGSCWTISGRVLAACAACRLRLSWPATTRVTSISPVCGCTATSATQALQAWRSAPCASRVCSWAVAKPRPSRRPSAPWWDGACCDACARSATSCARSRTGPSGRCCSRHCSGSRPWSSACSCQWLSRAKTWAAFRSSTPACRRLAACRRSCTSPASSTVARAAARASSGWLNRRAMLGRTAQGVSDSSRSGCGDALPG